MSDGKAPRIVIVQRDWIFMSIAVIITALRRVHPPELSVAMNDIAYSSVLKCRAAPQLSIDLDI